MISMEQPPSTDLVKLTIEGSRANIHLNREEKFNALNVQMITELCDLLDWTAERSAGRLDALHDDNGQPYLRSLVLSGAGRHFCAGADINICLLYTSPSPRDLSTSRMPSSA